VQVFNSVRSVDLIRGIARRQPRATAIVYRDRTITYAEVYERSVRLANVLLARGLKPGDRLGILAKNRPEYIEIYLATQLAGIVAVPVNFRLVANELQYILSNCDARGLIVAEEFLDVVDAIRHQLPALDGDCVIVLQDKNGGAECYEELLSAATVSEVKAKAALTDPAVIFYTSGTTGFPKGAVMSQLNIVQRMIALGWELGVHCRDVMLVPGPLFHLSFSFMSMIPLFIGGRSVILDEFGTSEVLDAIERYQVTRSFMVPKMFSLLVDELKGGGKGDRSSVRHFLSSGSALPRDVFEDLLIMFPNVRVAESMGWTESSWIVLCPHEDLLRKQGSAGRAAFGSELAILDEDGNELPHGQIGQIYGACPISFLGYYGNQEATAAMRRGKWETGGDVGYTDEEGFLYILDRKRDMIISGGENIYPAEVERVIGQHPQVLEVAVVGVADAKWGESPRACVVMKDGGKMSAEEVMRFCDGKLARYKLPRSVAFIDQLPRNSMGKVLRRELRDRFAAHGKSSPEGR
jgi:fatty-acyl-CoA synthase